MESSNIGKLRTATNKRGCTACSACIHRCSKECISFVEDKEGFLYPLVDENICVNCGLCIKVCHEQKPFEERKPLEVLVAYNKYDEVRNASSSGGLFFLLAHQTIKDGGVVFGAKFDEYWQVYITYAETLDDVKPFMGSKYVQARTDCSYKDAERFLKVGRKVLYSGTPCQVAGLKHFLRKEYANLITVDFVCHGVPSPKVWRMYLTEIVTSARQIGNIEFRNKRNGWKRFNFSMTYDEHNQTVQLTSNHNDNTYMQAFLSDMILRPSCHDCQAKNGRSHSDITIADYWGIEQAHPDLDDDKGTSLVLVNTEKGNTAIDWTETRHETSVYEKVLLYNPAIVRSATPHPKRTDFFAQLDAEESVTYLIIATLRPSLKQRIERLPHRCKFLIKRLLKLMEGKTDSVSSLRDYYISNHQVSAISFRDKQHGWKGYQMKIELKDSTKLQ